jgi:hypothetical protein
LEENHGVRRKRGDLFENLVIPKSHDFDQLYLVCVRTELIANRRPPIPLKFRDSCDKREILGAGMESESEI